MKFAKTHEWIKVENDTAIIGITHHAQEQLSDVVYVELPTVGDALVAGERFMSIESVKAASDIYAPTSGEVIAVNQDLADKPELVNQSPEDSGWLVKIKVAKGSNLNGLLDRAAYEASL